MLYLRIKGVCYLIHISPVMSWTYLPSGKKNLSFFFRTKLNYFFCYQWTDVCTCVYVLKNVLSFHMVRLLWYFNGTKSGRFNLILQLQVSIIINKWHWCNNFIRFISFVKLLIIEYYKRKPPQKSVVRA